MTALASLSLRDPAGRLFKIQGRLIRLVRVDAQSQIDTILKSVTVRDFTLHGKLVRTSVLDAEESGPLLPLLGKVSEWPLTEVGSVLEHPPVPFVSFPHEWPPEMLAEAGSLTLEFARALLKEGLGLKDATPQNILFSGPNAVFVDVLSVEKRDPLDPLWIPYAQFVRTFLNPLLVNKYFGLSLDLLLSTRREGVTPEEVTSLCGPLRRLLPPFLGLATIPTFLSKRASTPTAAKNTSVRSASREVAQFVLGTTFRRLERALRRARPSASRTSTWTGYMKALPYTAEQLAQKQAFVGEVLATHKPRAVLDVGCNTGTFSAMAAETGARVVAIDSDPSVVAEVFRNAQKRSLDILPLVVNLSQPTPATGWMNRENASFLQRATGAFDGVLMLAVLHHMMVTDGIPSSEVLKLAARLTKDFVVLEFIPPADPMFVRLARGRDYSHFTQERFENECAECFTIVRKESVVGSMRHLYLLKKKNWNV